MRIHPCVPWTSVCEAVHGRSATGEVVRTAKTVRWEGISWTKSARAGGEVEAASVSWSIFHPKPNLDPPARVSPRGEGQMQQKSRRGDEIKKLTWAIDVHQNDVQGKRRR